MRAAFPTSDACLPLTFHEFFPRPRFRQPFLFERRVCSPTNAGEPNPIDFAH